MVKTAALIDLCLPWSMLVVLVYIFFRSLYLQDIVLFVIERSEDMEISGAFLWQSLGILDFVGMTVCCLRYKEELRKSKPWYHVLGACICMHLGGTSLTGVMLGQVPGWMLDNRVIPSVLLAWWLVFCFPTNIMCTIVNWIPWGYDLLLLIDVLNSTHCTTTWGADKALLNEFHLNTSLLGKSWVAGILAGTISNCGGLVLLYIGDLLGPKPLDTKHAAVQLLIASFLVSCLYYSLVGDSSYGSRSTARGVVGVVHLFLHCYAQYAPHPCDFVSDTANLLFRLTCIAFALGPVRARRTRRHKLE
jgi:hypothetical protein